MPTPSSNTPLDPFDVWALTWLPRIAYGAIVSVLPLWLFVRWLGASKFATTCVVISIVVVALLAMIIALLWPCPFCGSPFQYRPQGFGEWGRGGLVVPGRTRCANCARAIEE